MRVELTRAIDAQFGFLEADHPVLELDPLEPGQKALSITSQDGYGVVIVGTPEELRGLVSRMVRSLE